MSAIAGRRWPARPVLVLGLALAAFAALYLYLLRNVGMANDEWTFMLYRASGFQAIVVPYNSGPVVGEILLYRLWGATVGVGHHWVLSLFYVALQGINVCLVYALARRRVGDWPALAAAVLVLVVGRAWETVLFPATLTFVAPALAACASWFALDRRPTWLAQLVVAGLLAGASVTGGLGPAVLLGLLVEVCLGRRWRWMWTIALGAVPVIVWYVGEASNTATHPGTNLPHLPVWALKHVTTAAAAVFGLPPAGGIAVILLGAAGILLWRRRAGTPAGSLWSPRAVGLLVTLAAAVLSIGVARAADTPATTSRYLYFPAIVIVLLACEWCRGLPAPRPGATAAAAAMIVAVAAGLGVQQLRDGKAFYLLRADGSAARMGAVVLAGGPRVVIEPGGLAYTPAVLRTFVRRFGSAPIDTEAQLARALPESQAAADQVLSAADVRRPGRLRACRRVPADGHVPRPPLTAVITSRQATPAQLVRFAPPGAGPGFLAQPPRTAFGLRPDRIRRPWRVLAPGAVSIRVCLA